MLNSTTNLVTGDVTLPPSENVDFYAGALGEAGYAGEQERIDLPSFSSLTVLGADGEPIVSIIATEENGTTTVILSLLGF